MNGLPVPPTDKHEDVSLGVSRYDPKSLNFRTIERQSSWKWPVWSLMREWSTRGSEEKR
jgi:hypothetical protein